MKKPRVMIDLRAKLEACGHEVTTMVFDRTGERMAFASEPVSVRKKGAPTPERPVRVWVARVRDGAILHELVMPTRLEPSWDWWPREMAEVALDFSPDGTTLAVAWGLEEMQSVESRCMAVFDLDRGVLVDQGLCARGELCFSPDSRWLVISADEWGSETRWLSRDKNWQADNKGPVTPGSKVVFSADGKRLIVVDQDSSRHALGVTFVDAESHELAGRSRPVKLLHWEGLLVVAPDGRSALGECTVGQTAKKGSRGQRGVWRWRPGAAPERVATPPVSERETESGRKKVSCEELVWIDPEGRALLWCDGNGELVRQYIGQLRTQRIPLAPASARLKTWEVKVSPDGKRIARIGDAQVVFTRLRRREPARSARGTP